MDSFLTKIIGYSHEWFGGTFPGLTKEELEARDKTLGPFYEKLMAEIEVEKGQGKWQKRPIVEYVAEPEAPLKWWQKPVTNNKVWNGIIAIPFLILALIVAIVTGFQ